LSSKTANYTKRNEQLFRDREELLQRLEGLDANDPAHRMRRRRYMAMLDRNTHELVELNQGLVGNYVKRFAGHSPHLNDDLMSAGTTGLIVAIQSYSTGKGAGFAHWAHRFIKREVLHEVRNHDHPTLGQSDFEKRPDILNAQLQLEIDQPYRVPSETEVAEAAGVSVAQARRVMAPPRLLSLDRQADNDDGGSTSELVESIPNPDLSVEAAVLGKLDGAALATIAQSVLTTRERFVLARRFGLDGEPPQTLAAVGAALGLSRESVRNVQSAALRKLTEPAVVGRLTAEVGLAQDLAHTG